MFSHVTVGCSDFERAMRFYEPILAALGLKLRFRETDTWAGWQPDEGGRPLFIVLKPLDGAAATVGNGGMIAFQAADRARVDTCHALALANGGSDEGAPGLRPHYHDAYYGAYVRDPDGNKLCIVCHSADTPQA